jgi:hypothetical protein
LIKTDQRSLVNLTDQRLTTPWQHKVLTKLLGLQFKIVYKKGLDNRVADALSRNPSLATDQLMAISHSTPVWLEEVVKGYQVDEQSQKLLAKLVISSPFDNFSLGDGLIRIFDTRVEFSWETTMPCSPKSYKLCMMGQLEAILGSMPPTTESNDYLPGLASRNLSRPGSHKSQCSICQRAKTEGVPYPGLLQPLKIPSGAWEVVTMDFVDGLPRSVGFNCIMVVVDKFSRYAHFVPLSHPYTALSVATAYMKEIFKLHSLPRAIVSDRDPIFTSKVQKELFKQSDTQLHMSSAHHPESDGQTERVNQCMEKDYLRCYVHSCQTKWVQWLHLADFWYNTSYHTSLGKTPFKVLYGHSPHVLGIDRVEACALPNLEEWHRERALMTKLLQQHVERVQQRMKSQADKGRTERSFAVGDWVYLKLQPYLQSSFEHHSNYKLSFRFYGPYEVEQRVGEVTYKLKLPATSMIHPVIHVSQLKKSVAKDAMVLKDLPTEPPALQVPDKILARHQRRLGAILRNEVLIPGPVYLMLLQLGKICRLFVFISLMHRLGDKPVLKEMGMSRTLSDSSRETLLAG